MDRIPVITDHNFHGIKIQQLSETFDRFESRRHVRIVVVDKNLDRGIDRFGGDERLIALDIHDDGIFGKCLCDLRKAVRPGPMLRRSHHGFKTTSLNDIHDPFVVGSDDHSSHRRGRACSFRRVKDERSPFDGQKELPR